MSAMTFDTLKFVKNLVAAGMPEKQAEALAVEQTDIVDNKLVTKGDLENVRLVLRADIEKLRTEVRGELTLLKWMMGLVIVAVVIPLFKDLLT